MLADKSIILTHRRWVIGQIRLDCHNSIYVLISPRSLFNKGSMGLPRVWDPKTVLLKRNRCDDFNLMEKWPKYSRPVEWDILALKLINNRLPNVNADFHIVGDSGIHKSKDIGRQTLRIFRLFAVPQPLVHESLDRFMIIIWIVIISDVIKSGNIKNDNTWSRRYICLTLKDLKDSSDSSPMHDPPNLWSNFPLVWIVSQSKSVHRIQWPLIKMLLLDSKVA